MSKIKNKKMQRIGPREI